MRTTRDISQNKKFIADNLKKKKFPRGYWDTYQSKYPYQVEVPHMSDQDPDPRTVQHLMNVDFLRVPFDGIAHWGFLTRNDLEKFQHTWGS